MLLDGVVDLLLGICAGCGIIRKGRVCEGRDCCTVGDEPRLDDLVPRACGVLRAAGCTEPDSRDFRRTQRLGQGGGERQARLGPLGGYTERLSGLPGVLQR